MSFYANKMKGIILELLGIAGILRQNWNFEKIHILTEDTLWWTIFEKCNKTLEKISLSIKRKKRKIVVFSLQPPLNEVETSCIP